MGEDLGLNTLNGCQNEKKIKNGSETIGKENDGLTFTVDDAVNRAGYGKFQIRLLILAGVGWIADACEIFILSVIGDFLACDWSMHRWQIALLTSIVFVGISIGSPVFGILADLYGRKKSLVGSLALLFVFGSVSAASPSYVWMVVFRGCMGFAVGGLAQGLTLCTEYCPTNMRGKAGLYLCVGLTFTVDDAVNRAGYGKFQIRLLILAGVGWIADACEIFILSVIGDFLACDWSMHRWQIALLTSIVFVGISIGSPVFGILADLYGRKKSLVGSLALLFVFGSVSAASPSYVWMVVFRGCMGFAVGGLAQGLTLCTEYCPTNMRGKAGLYLCYFWSIGTVGVTLIAWVVMNQLNDWRVLLVIVALPSLGGVLVWKWYPESARFYLVSNQRDQAIRVLQEMATMNGVDLPPGHLVEVSEEQKRGQVKDLLSKEYRLSSILFWYIWFATAFSYYGIALVSPIIIQEGSLSAIMNNTNETHFGDMQNVMPCTEFTSENFIDLLWTSAAEFPGLILFTVLVERCNRKVLLSTTCIIGSILVMLLLLNTQNIITLLILFAARGILLADFQLIFVVTSETYPTTIRSVGMGFGSSWCRIGGLIVPYVAQVLVVESPVGAMCLIGGVLFLAGVACIFLPFETRGMKMKEIQ